MKSALILTVILGIASLSPSKRLTSSPEADRYYSERTSQALNSEEQRIVGKWTGKNRELEWEILRKSDGTYGIVIHEEYEGTLYKDYYRGVWGIKGNEYYYFDLESSDENAEFDLTPSLEKILNISETEFLTSSEGWDGETLESSERKIEKFRFKLWETYK